MCWRFERCETCLNFRSCNRLWRLCDHWQLNHRTRKTLEWWHTAKLSRLMITFVPNEGSCLLVPCCTNGKHVHNVWVWRTRTWVTMVGKCHRLGILPLPVQCRQKAFIQHRFAFYHFPTFKRGKRRWHLVRRCYSYCVRQNAVLIAWCIKIRDLCMYLGTSMCPPKKTIP